METGSLTYRLQTSRIILKINDPREFVRYRRLLRYWENNQFTYGRIYPIIQLIIVGCFKNGITPTCPRPVRRTKVGRGMLVIHRVYRGSHQYAILRRQTLRTLGVSTKPILHLGISTRKDDTPSYGCAAFLRPPSADSR